MSSDKNTNIEEQFAEEVSEVALMALYAKRYGNKVQRVPCVQGSVFQTPVA